MLDLILRFLGRAAPDLGVIGLSVVRLAVASLALPTLVVMEGGYAVDALGTNVVAFLSGF